jgi:hypothetical protein
MYMYMIKPYMHVQYINRTLFTLWFKILFGIQEWSTHQIIDWICLSDRIQINILWTYFKGMIDLITWTCIAYIHVHMHTYTQKSMYEIVDLKCIQQFAMHIHQIRKRRGFIYICWPNLSQSHLRPHFFNINCFSKIFFKHWVGRWGKNKEKIWKKNSTSFLFQIKTLKMY